MSGFRFLGISMSENVSWTSHISILVRKALKQLYSLRELQKEKFPCQAPFNLYRGAIASILTGNNTKWDTHNPGGPMKSAQNITGIHSLSINDISAGVNPDYRAASLCRLWDSPIQFNSIPHFTINKRRVFFVLFCAHCKGTAVWISLYNPVLQKEKSINLDPYGLGFKFMIQIIHLEIFHISHSFFIFRNVLLSSVWHH